MAKRRRKINKRGKLLIIILSMIFVVLGGYVVVDKFIPINNKTDKRIIKKINLDEVKNNYGHFVKANTQIDILDKDKKEVGLINKDAEFVLDDNYDIKDKYYKLAGNDYYIDYKLVSKIDNLSELGFNEYNTYKNYIATNIITTNDNYKLYIKDKEYYSINGNDKYDVIITDDDQYGIIFNDRLVYINKSDVKDISDKDISVELLKGLPVLNYHYTVNKEAGELNECTQSICMEDKQVEEEIKYLTDNNYYSLTMRDVYLFLTGKIKLPKNSVAITIDDGWYVSRMISILEKYKMTGTLFLIGSLASPNDYKSNYLEIHSHSWNMHTPGICSGTHGGAILCWEKDKILEDLKKSRDSLNNTTVYCFPFYEYNDRVIEYLKEAGFEMAFIGGDKKAYVGDNIFKIHRFELVNYTDMDTFVKYVT